MLRPYLARFPAGDSFSDISALAVADNRLAKRRHLWIAAATTQGAVKSGFVQAE